MKLKAPFMMLCEHFLVASREYGFNKYNIRNNVSIVAFYTLYNKLCDVILRYFKYYVVTFMYLNIYAHYLHV
jgi:hypothetical protein